ncbi:PASTA domain-containing protein [Nonomuraea dietziae]|uniref:PASTA domain-containing protein n=1 Tax=Nonomuraea dietziae TaxID=65515 RepID=UPI0031D279C5
MAGIAAVAVLGVGAGAVALTGMNAPSGPMETATAAPVGGDVSTKPSSTRTTRKQRPPEPTEDPSPTEKETVEPTTRPTTAKPSITPSTSPTPTHVKQPLVPNVMDMFIEEATKKVQASGYQIRVKSEMVMEPDSCKKVSGQVPAPGKPLAKGKTVTVAVVSDICPPGKSPSPSPSTSPTPSTSPSPTITAKP